MREFREVQINLHRQIGQAMAFALALRHSWRREELVKFARRLGVKLTAKDLSEVTSADAADAPASEAVALGASEASVH